LKKNGFVSSTQIVDDVDSTVDELLALENGGGFAYEKHGIPSLCSTFYVLSALGALTECDSRFNERVKPNQILDFLDNTYSEEEVGGYSSQVGEHPNLIHTRYALQILRFLLHYKFINLETAAQRLHPDKTVKFVNSHLSGNGYGIKPRIAPTVFSTRAAVKIIKIIKIFELNGLFNPKEQYSHEMRKFYASIHKIEKFLQSCRDTMGLTYAGVPFPQKG
jgi:hypothetical protein